MRQLWCQKSWGCSTSSSRLMKYEHWESVESLAVKTLKVHTQISGRRDWMGWELSWVWLSSGWQKLFNYAFDVRQMPLAGTPHKALVLQNSKLNSLCLVQLCLAVALIQFAAQRSRIALLCAPRGGWAICAGIGRSVNICQHTRASPNWFRPASVRTRNARREVHI